jgi:hypothetical protein
MRGLRLDLRVDLRVDLRADLRVDFRVEPRADLRLLSEDSSDRDVLRVDRFEVLRFEDFF